MKGKLLSISLICLAFLITVLTVGCQEQEDDGLITVRLNEVVRSIFYAPQYVALEKGFFEDEGLRIVLSVGQGADRSMTALIAGEADIALLGTEAGIYVYIEGRADYAKAFAQLTQRAGNYLVARESSDNFSWEQVRGKSIIGGRIGGMPQMILEYVLYQNGIIPGQDVEIITNLQFASTAGAFAGGIGDFTAEFDPSALALEQSGHGHVVAALGAESGYVPYTVYMALGSYIERNPEIIQRFTNAIYRGQRWVANHTSRQIAEVVHPYFRESTIDELEVMISRYKEQGVWRADPMFDKDAFEQLQNIMEHGGMLQRRVAFESLIDPRFAEQAVLQDAR